MGCFVCRLENDIVRKHQAWICSRPTGFVNNEIYFLRTIRHVEHLAKLNNEESVEMGDLIRFYSRKLTRETGARLVVVMSLGFGEAHMYWWIVAHVGKNKQVLFAIRDVLAQAISQWA